MEKSGYIVAADGSSKTSCTKELPFLSPHQGPLKCCENEWKENLPVHEYANQSKQQPKVNTDHNLFLSCVLPLQIFHERSKCRFGAARAFPSTCSPL